MSDKLAALRAQVVPMRTREDMAAAYPEHQKMVDQTVQQTAVEGICRLIERTPDLAICEYITNEVDAYGQPNDPYWIPVADGRIRTLIATYLGIDEARLEAEKHEMLRQLRLAHAIREEERCCLPTPNALPSTPCSPTTTAPSSE